MNNRYSARSLALAACLAGWGLGAVAADPWKSIALAADPALLSDEIQLVRPGRDGSVFIGTLAGVARLQGDTLTKVLEATGGGPQAQPPKVWSIHEQADGTLWVGHDRGVVRLAGGQRQDFLSGLQVAPIIEVKPGRLWAIGKTAGGAGLHEWDGGAWKPVPGTERYRIEDMTATSSGRVWVIVEGNGVLEVDPEAGFAKATHHLQGITVTTVQELAGRDGAPPQVWAGTWSRGVAVWDGKEWTRQLESLKQSSVLQLARDTSGVTWVGTSASGLFRSDPELAGWQQEFADEGAINLLVADRQGNVWISGQQTGGLRRHGPEGWSVSLDNPLPIQCLAEASDGRIVAGGALDGLHVLARPPKGTP